MCMYWGSTKKLASLFPMCSDKLTFDFTSIPLSFLRPAWRTGTDPSMFRVTFWALSKKFWPPHLNWPVVERTC